MGHHPAAKYRATRFPVNVSGRASEDNGEADPSLDRRGGSDEMAEAAHADALLDGAKLRDARWHRATVGDVLLREATNMRPTGRKRDGRTMVLARGLWWRCGGWAQWWRSGRRSQM